MGIFRFFVCLFLLLVSSACIRQSIRTMMGFPMHGRRSNGLNKYNYADADSDADNDGLTALEEFQYGTSAIQQMTTDRDDAS